MRFSLLAACLLTTLVAPAAGQDLTGPNPLGPDQLTFSLDNMDTSVSPAEDFGAYAAGGWQKRVTLPIDKADIQVFSFMQDHVREQMVSVIDTAARNAGTATPGSPEQQVGDLYTSFMDVEALNAAGMTPLQPELDRLSAVASSDDLARYLGYFGRTTGSFVFGGIVPSEDRVDPTKMVLYFVSGGLGLALDAVFDEADGSARLEAYRAYIVETQQAAGDSADVARATADLAISIERALHVGKATPVERSDPRNTYDPVPFAELAANSPDLDLRLVAEGFGVEPTETIVKTEPRYLAALSQVLRNHPLDEIKTYLRYRLIQQYSTYLGTRFDAPLANLTRAILGISQVPPRIEAAQTLLREQLGHPLSRLYVDAYFKEETRQVALDMIGRIKAAFLERIKTRTWLGEATRAEAINKLDKLFYRVGYPDTWIDYSSVRIAPNDLIGNITRLTSFSTEREIARLGKPVVQDQFADSGATLPIVVNAAYSLSLNGFEVPAAILQPGMFELDQPAPVYFCRLGAVLGHEMTHGFDSGGRLFDANGNLRDWWTEDDAAAFDAEVQKLIDQADAFEVLPGVDVNGALTVKENMADYGGITLAHDALMAYLDDHPDENVAVGGLTPSQLCFVAWGQLWATKATEQYTNALVSSDVHAPGRYRAFAALQHLDAFYEAFGIMRGNPMWLPPEKRVHAW